MIKVMLESYCKEIPYNDDGGVQLMLKLERILTDIEEAGILPPLTESGKQDFYTSDRAALDISRVHKVHVWEPEDG